jgi:hypothetical protein
MTTSHYNNMDTLFRPCRNPQTGLEIPTRYLNRKFAGWYGVLRTSNPRPPLKPERVTRGLPVNTRIQDWRKERKKKREAESGKEVKILHIRIAQSANRVSLVKHSDEIVTAYLKEGGYLPSGIGPAGQGCSYFFC